MSDTECTCKAADMPFGRCCKAKKLSSPTLPQRAPVAEWRLPEDSPPPRGTKLQVLTVYGVATMGAWSDLDCVAWAPLIQINARIRERMLEKQQQIRERNTA